MRGQTTIDFLVGASVFLLTVGFVFASLPSVFAPFAGGDEATTLAADRAAATLVEDDLAREGRPGVLNATCTRQFFDESLAGPCSPAALDAALGLDAPDSVNVTVEEDGSVRELDGTALRAGPSPPDSVGVVVAHRLVTVDGEESHLYVRTW
jgi:hypothetical protein